jgi:hypothetical protein
MDPFPIALSPSSTAPAVLGAAPKRARRTTEENDSFSPNLADFSFSYASSSSEMVFVAMHVTMHEDSWLSIVSGSLFLDRFADIGYGTGECVGLDF